MSSISKLCTNNDKHYKSISPTLRKFHAQHGQEIKEVNEKLLRYQTLGKILRFIWPNVGVDNEKRHFIWGYVEINRGGRWGSICNVRGQFTDFDARAVCRTAGYESGVFDNNRYRQPFDNHRRSVKAPRVWLDDRLRCKGDETTVEQCPGRKWSPSRSCHRRYDIGIKCYL